MPSVSQPILPMRVVEGPEQARCLVVHPDGPDEPSLQCCLGEHMSPADPSRPWHVAQGAGWVVVWREIDGRVVSWTGGVR